MFYIGLGDNAVSTAAFISGQQLSEYECTLQMDSEGRPIYPTLPSGADNPSYDASLSVIRPSINDVCLDLAIPDRCLKNKPTDAEEQAWEDLPTDHPYMKASAMLWVMAMLQQSLSCADNDALLGVEIQKSICKFWR